MLTGFLNTDIWDAARARPDKFGGPRRMDPAIAGQWKEALLPQRAQPQFKRASVDVATGGGYLAYALDALQASIVILDEKDGF